jgi:hypothetical protein
MSADPGMAHLNGLLDYLWIADLRGACQRYQDELLEQRSAAASAEAQERYESGVIDEARAIVTEDVEMAPTVEHLRVLLVWMDGAMSAPEQEDGEAPF